MTTDPITLVESQRKRIAALEAENERLLKAMTTAFDRLLPVVDVTEDRSFRRALFDLGKAVEASDH